MEDLGKPRRRKTGGGSKSRKEKFPSSVSTLPSSTIMCLIGFHLPWQQNTATAATSSLPPNSIAGTEIASLGGRFLLDPSAEAEEAISGNGDNDDDVVLNRRDLTYEESSFDPGVADPNPTFPPFKSVMLTNPKFMGALPVVWYRVVEIRDPSVILWSLVGSKKSRMRRRMRAFLTMETGCLARSDIAPLLRARTVIV
ncbi:hypothetical protein LINPERHAP1_LOCUS15984 [Linum perenne]